METGLSASDVALLNHNDGFMGGNGGAFWIFALLILANGGFGGWGNRSDFGQYATAASQQEILFGQQFQNLDNKMDRLGNGIADATFSLNNSIKDCCCTSQRNTDALRYDMATQIANTNATVTAQTQKILDAMAQNKIESLQAEVNSLKTQNMFCGIPRINPYGYGVYPYANGCGCQYSNNI